MKMTWNRNCKIPHTVLERGTLCFSSLKVNMWWVGARERTKRAFFVPFILSEGNFINICVLSQCLVYWIHIHNIRSFTYQKSLPHTLFCLFLKLPKAFSVKGKLANAHYWTITLSNWQKQEPEVFFKRSCS